MARKYEGDLPERIGMSRPVRQSVKNLMEKPTWTPKQSRKKVEPAEKASRPAAQASRPPKSSGQKRVLAGESDITGQRGHGAHQREREPKRVKTASQNQAPTSAHGKVRKYLPPTIAVDNGEDSEEEEFPERIRRGPGERSTNVRKARRLLVEDDERNDDHGERLESEENDGEGSEDVEAEENERSLVDAANLFDESVVIKDRGHQRQRNAPARAHHDSDHNRRVRSRSASSSSRYRTDRHDGPPTTDDDDFFNRDVDEEQEEGNNEDSHSVAEGSGDDLEAELFASSRRGRQVTEKRRRAVHKKLDEERPVITTKRRPSDAQTSEDDGDGGDDADWMPRSKLHLSYQNSTPRVNIKEQSGIIQAVIRRAVDLGEVYLVLGAPNTNSMTPEEAATMNTPFSVSGLHSIAITALVAAAQEHGYNQEGDIIDRLKHGSVKMYIKPIRSHVFQRLSIARSDILRKITSALPSVIKVDKSSKIFLSRLLTKSSYIFPLKEGSRDKFVTAKAYSSEIVIESLKIGFGLLESIHVPKLYTSSHEDFEQEREIPPQMVALAATTDYAILQHLLYDGAGNINDFSTPALQSVFQAHMVRLLEWKRRHPRLFHKYMHQQYKTVIGIGAGVVGEQTTDEIINEVDWDNMMDSDDGPMGPVGA